MDDRLIAVWIVLLAGAGVWAASIGYRGWLRRARRQPAMPGHLALPGDGRPVVLAFSGEYCLPCRTQQRPALERLQSRVGAAVHVREIDALQNMDLAEHYGVLTVPTTVVLDGRRRIVAVNYGVTTTDKLMRQLEPHLTLPPAVALASAE